MERVDIYMTVVTVSIVMALYLQECGFIFLPSALVAAAVICAALTIKDAREKYEGEGGGTGKDL